MGVTVPMEVVREEVWGCVVPAAARVPVLAIERGQWREQREVLARSRPSCAHAPILSSCLVWKPFPYMEKVKGDTETHFKG